MVLFSDFLSVDVEGLDYEILNSMHLDGFRPKVICVETSIHNWGSPVVKRTKTIDLVLNKG